MRREVIHTRDDLSNGLALCAEIDDALRDGRHLALDAFHAFDGLLHGVPSGARDFRRPKHVAGTVVRFVGSQIVVSCVMRDGGSQYLHSFDRRRVRIGSGQYSELVNAEAPKPASTDLRRQAARVDAAYRE